MQSKVILKVMYMLLSYANVDIYSLDDDIHCNLSQLSDAISIESETKEETYRLIAIGFHESKFNFEGKDPIVSVKGACGVYQQLPKYSLPQKSKKTCKDLMDSYESTESAVLMIRLIKKLWGNLDKSICHYFSGNECTEDNGGIRYAKKHKRIMKRIKRYIKKDDIKIINLIREKSDSCQSC